MASSRRLPVPDPEPTPRVVEPEPWTEARLGSLVPYELEAQEFKGSAWTFMPSTGKVRADFVDKLSKQISAFSNAGGGCLFLGIDDAGKIDGGVPTALRANGTREWFEDILPGIVDPPLRSFDVHEVSPESPQSPIKPGHAVYVLELPDSEDAPHQARDRRYYLRIAGKSRPMSHRHVLDILQRRRDPEVAVLAIAPYGRPDEVQDPRGPSVLLRLRARIENRGRSLAQHVGLELTLPRFAVNTICRKRTLEGGAASLQQSPGEVTYFFYSQTPLFPRQERVLGTVWIAIHGQNRSHYQQGRVSLRFRVFADHAPPREGEVNVAAYSAVRRGLSLTEGSS
ncbi:MAG: ATP-binding protein [Planctomycetes bacterium]|nr:ATP-binding protein [Planctomycetota bacterium]